MTETTVKSSENKKLEDKLRLMTPDNDDKDGERTVLKIETKLFHRNGLMDSLTCRWIDG